MKHPWFFPAGDYIGQMKNGLAHGKGTYTSSFKGKKKGTYKYYYKGLSHGLTAEKHVIIGESIEEFNTFKDSMFKV
jgi:hypothetical protein